MIASTRLLWNLLIMRVDLSVVDLPDLRRARVIRSARRRRPRAPRVIKLVRVVAMVVYRVIARWGQHLYLGTVGLQCLTQLHRRVLHELWV